jgi:hypothetical protein
MDEILVLEKRHDVTSHQTRVFLKRSIPPFRMLATELHNTPKFQLFETVFERRSEPPQ